jgi:glycosyltransferase involved in cell wall biosynthesis
MIDNLPFHTPPITIAVTTYNRSPQMVIDSFRDVMDHPAIAQILVVDDCSDPVNFIDLCAALSELPCHTVQVKNNPQNLGMSRNKANAISLSPTDWVLILDSDNALYKESIDAICDVSNLDPNVIYCPSFAAPHFDYREYEGMTFGIKDVAGRIKERTMSLMLNTCNYLVHKETYGKIYDYNPEVKESDTIWFNYLWLRSGRKLHVVPNWHYSHLVHEGSGWKQNANENMKMAERIKTQIVMEANGNV